MSARTEEALVAIVVIFLPAILPVLLVLFMGIFAEISCWRLSRLRHNHETAAVAYERYCEKGVDVVRLARYWMVHHGRR